jgi:hypothetical protein
MMSKKLVYFVVDKNAEGMKDFDKWATSVADIVGKINVDDALKDRATWERVMSALSVQISEKYDAEGRVERLARHQEDSVAVINAAGGN